MAASLRSTPVQDGFHMPAEFETHAGCWMLWPVRNDVWRSEAEPAQAAFTSVAAAIARFEPVSMGVSARQFQHARSLLPSSVRVVELSSDDAWIRDSGPTFVVNDQGEVRGVDWKFNAWGGLYSPWEQDSLVAQKVVEIEKLDRYHVEDFILEGGSIHVDGQGTVITTEECLLNPNRNPQLSRSEIESRLQSYLGVESVIWLPQGIFNDETSGHVDNLCSFVRPAVVALTWTEDRTDPQFERSQGAFEVLSNAVDARERRIEIHKINQPAPQYMTPQESQGIHPTLGTKARISGERLAASYINFYIANRGVVVPLFNDPNDLPALQRIQDLFPAYNIIGIQAREILLGGGNIHCITLNQPSCSEYAH